MWENKKVSYYRIYVFFLHRFFYLELRFQINIFPTDKMYIGITKLSSIPTVFRMFYFDTDPRIRFRWLRIRIWGNFNSVNLVSIKCFAMYFHINFIYYIIRNVAKNRLLRESVESVASLGWNRSRYFWAIKYFCALKL